MNVNLENPSALRRKLTIELEPAEIKTELDRAYNDLRRNVVLKGFRPGHAPRTMLERLFGDRVRGEIVQKLIKEYTDKALEEQNLKPLLPPEIVTEESDLAKALRFSATFDLRPEIVVRDYQGLRVPRSKVEVIASEVEFLSPAPRGGERSAQPAGEDAPESTPAPAAAPTPSGASPRRKKEPAAA